ncbi:MAG: alpha-ketoglutarate-dependent dioxygenase AlkB [Gammaproteobacteria bacterium]|nr:alpha-ketoglutarate-dependent dioxygenase AlkB [Gammaproteobacteria bacterium]
MSQVSNTETPLQTNLLPFDGEAYLDNRYFSAAESSHYFNCLKDEIHWEHKEIRIYGRFVLQPRLIAWYGDPGIMLKYSSLNLISTPWTTALTNIKTTIEEDLGYSFNGVFLNYYRNGHDYMGWHRDNERVHGLQPLIISISFGAARLFKFRHYRQKDIVKNLKLNSGSLLIMQGDTQENWTHSLPKSLKVNEPRINLTFRNIYQ